MSPNAVLRPSTAWLAVFLPALAYYMCTRLIAAGLFRSSSIGQLVQNELSVGSDQQRPLRKNSCESLATVFYVSSCPDHAQDTRDIRVPLARPVFMVQDGTLSGLTATVWQHDSELGRGYVLVSVSEGSGRIWRWETGGGPIAIGRSLSVDDSGCRSNNYLTCSSTTPSQIGSGGIAVDSSSSDEHFAEGRLVVSEWGEGRIVRMEENGARTPLVLQLPNLPCSESDTRLRRVHRPSSMIFTPFGDLLFVDDDPTRDCDQPQNGLYLLRQIGNIDSLPSLSVSRQAHAWTSVDHDVPDLVYQSLRVGGITLSKSWVDVLTTTEVSRDDDTDRVLLVSLSLQEQDDDDDDDDDNDKANGSAAPNGKLQHPKTLLDISKYATRAGPVAMDKSGNVFLASDNGVLVLDPSFRVIGTLALPVVPVSLTVGEDCFLYIGTSDSLLRVKIRQGPVSVPTNLIKKRP